GGGRAEIGCHADARRNRHPGSGTVRRKRNIVGLMIFMALTKTSTAHAQRLDDIVDIISFAWSHGDAKALVAMGGRDGIAIETPTGRSGPMSARQAIAVLRRVFVERETISLK